MFYRVIRGLLFLLPPECAHYIVLYSLRLLNKIGLLKLYTNHNLPKVCKPIQAMGLIFGNPVGLAAGFDKNGEFIDECFALGFAFVEVGTVTPKPQTGSVKPRLFRLIKSKALINRMGFNNKGVDYLCKQLQTSEKQGILGINIGKNKHTPLSRACDDYMYCLEKVYDYADYIVINISSPNTQGLRNLQSGNELVKLLSCMTRKQKSLSIYYKKYVPLVLKISPDVTSVELRELAIQLIKYKIDGVIVSNTTLSREKVMCSEDLTLAKESGGLSGEPLFPLSNNIVADLSLLLKSSNIPIIGVGGIGTSEMAWLKIQQGATLVQLYTGLIYNGPKLVTDVVKRLSIYN